ncbi:anti-sigma factor family protein [Gilvibacter sp.]|uniref:anti-sigma factor family protein n=1 Tax=Gilvibacter sp. TaxID=2729997 RepID=UPI003F49FE03
MTNQDLKDIIALLRGELTADEAQRLQKRLEADPELMEYYLLEKQQFEALDESQWPKATTDDKDFKKFHKAAQSDAVINLQQQLEARKVNTTKVIPLYQRSYFKWVAAVAIIALVVSGLLLGGQEDPQTLYAQYIDMDDVPTLTVRSDSDSIYGVLENQFQSGNYQEFLSNLQENDTLPANASLLLYEGLAYTELNNATKAIETFDELIGKRSY